MKALSIEEKEKNNQKKNLKVNFSFFLNTFGGFSRQIKIKDLLFLSLNQKIKKGKERKGLYLDLVF